MPNYEFVCRQCQANDERLLQCRDRNTVQTCNCGGALERVQNYRSMTIQVPRSFRVERSDLVQPEDEELIAAKRKSGEFTPWKGGRWT